MRVLEELNINEGGWPVERQPPTDEQIQCFESYFNVKLPEDYLSLLRHANGGHPELDSFRPQGAIEEHLWGMSRFYHLTDDKSDLECLWRAASVWRTEVGKDIIPIADDQGGNQIVLSFDSSPPSVNICIHDESYRTVRIADSFGEFIDMLCEDPDMI